MLISIVIPTCNRPSTLGIAIESIINTNFCDYELLIVDQSGNDDTKQLVTGKYKHNKVHYLHSTTQCSSDSRNIGWQKASAEYVAFTDDDAFVDENWLQAYATEITQSKPNVGLIGGRIIPIFEKPRPHWLPEEKDYFLPSFDAGSETIPFPPESLPISVNLVASKVLLEAIGGFDTRLGLKNGADVPFVTGGEDSFLGIKARKAGFPITYLPSAVVYHPITADRLKVDFFLRRSFREGATTIAVENVKSPYSREHFLGHMNWHRRNVLFLLKKILGCALLSSNQRSKAFMLTASEIAFSCGVIQYSRYLKNKLDK